MKARRIAVVAALSLIWASGSGCGGSDPGVTPTVPAAATPTPASPTVDGRVVCLGPNSGIALIVSPAIIDGIRAELTRFELNLCREGHNVIETARAYTSAPQLRAQLAGVYSMAGIRLEGVILIGEHPLAYQWVTAPGSGGSPGPGQEVISYQYYSDLNGVFGSSASYRSPGGRESSFDLRSGDLDWEIWTSVLPVYRGDRNLTIQAVNRYLVKNDAYRTGQGSIPRRYLEVSEYFKAKTVNEHQTYLIQMRDGQFSWKPFSSATDALLYFDSEVAPLSVDQGYAYLSEGVADFTVAGAPGFWGAHGKLTTAWAESTPVRTVFFWSDAPAVGDLDQPRNFLTAVLYSATSHALIARGTTNMSGGMGSNGNGYFGHNIATALGQGAGFGNAIRQHVNSPLMRPWSESREYHFASSVTLGDGTLKIRR